MKETFYYWEDGRPKSIDRSETYTCFITGESITSSDDAYWTQEFDSYISERGYQMIQDAQSTGEIENNPEWRIIYGEWYAKDESVMGRQEMWQSEQMSKSADDAGLYDE